MQEQDKLLQLLKQELAADMQELQKQENPPYHMNFRVMDDRTVNISSSFGATMMSVEQHSRSMVPQIRVGDTILDNFKYNAMVPRQIQRGSTGGLFWDWMMKKVLMQLVRQSGLKV